MKSTSITDRVPPALPFAPDSADGSASRAIPERVDWVDFAKAICIVAVVTMYATHHIQQIAGRAGWMQAVVDFAQPFRMPDFFLIAGLFVSRVLSRPLRAYLDAKVLYFLYFYAVWASFRFAATHLGTVPDRDWPTLISAYLQLYIEPPSGPLWFIYVLALFFVAVRLLRAVPPWIVFAGAAAIQVLHLDTGVSFVDKFTWYFVFFYAGYVLAPQVFRLASWAQAHPMPAATILALWFIANGLLVASGIAQLQGMSLLLGFAGAFAVMLVATLLARMPGMKWFSYLGRHSIVVYLAFVIPLGFMRWLASAAILPANTGAASLLASVISVAGALALFWTLRQTPLRFLFIRPAWTHIDNASSKALKTRATGTTTA